MALKVMVPVFPSERFYDAVVAAADLLAQEGGVLTFLFTRLRAPQSVADKAPSHHVTAELEVPPDFGDVDEDDIEAWQEDQRQALSDARDLCYERGIDDNQLNVAFADSETPSAQAIFDEAAAGGYDAVVLARAYLTELPDLPGESGSDVAHELQSLAEDGVRLLVT